VIPAVPVVTMLVWLFFSHTRLRVRLAPGVPHALPGSEGRTSCKTRAPVACGIAKPCREFEMSCPDLIRASINLRKSVFRSGWIGGSSPAMPSELGCLKFESAHARMRVTSPLVGEGAHRRCGNIGGLLRESLSSGDALAPTGWLAMASRLPCAPRQLAGNEFCLHSANHKPSGLVGERMASCCVSRSWPRLFH
jgi:hypothetical protein